MPWHDQFHDLSRRFIFFAIIWEIALQKESLPRLQRGESFIPASLTSFL